MRTKHLARAIKLAATFHERQHTRDGMPYILHCLHVMDNVKTLHQKVIAVLHDIIEDTAMDAPRLKVEGLPTTAVDAIEALTHDPRDSYTEYITNLIDEEIADALIVKLADLEHNMDLSRLPTVTEKDKDRVVKYKKAHARIVAALVELEKMEALEE